MIAKILLMNMLISIANTHATTTKIDRSAESRIRNACIRSFEIRAKKPHDFKSICQCVATTHYRSAVQDTNQKEASEHIKWTVDFYETSDEQQLQRLVNQNRKYSSFDDQVVDDCIERSRGRSGT